MSNNLSSPRNQEVYWISLLFALLTVWLATGPLRFDSPVTIHASVPESVTDPTPIRQPAVRPSYRVGKFTYQCNECHRSVPAPRTVGHGLTKHNDVHLAHGINTRCLNCHHAVNREVFVDDFGEEIPWDQPQLLCAKCHGPVYRDWQHGSHGRINGYWDESRGVQIRLKCIECHDPHHPPFPPLASAPPPQTLRGTPQSDASHAGVRNPLRLAETALTGEHVAENPVDVDDE